MTRASLDSVLCDPERGVDKATIGQLATRKWIQANIIVVRAPRLRGRLSASVSCAASVQATSHKIHYVNFLNWSLQTDAGHPVTLAARAPAGARRPEAAFLEPEFSTPGRSSLTKSFPLIRWKANQDWLPSF